MAFARMMLASLVGVLALSATGSAAIINYGNFGPLPSGAVFLNVTESSVTDPVPLYGAPMVFTTGLDFNPVTFASSSSGVGANLTEGQLNFTLAGPVIQSVALFEAGDCTLAGAGTSATQAFAGAILRMTVTAIDGVNVAPIAVPPVNASVGFNLAANPGIVQPWSLGLGANLDLFLASQGIPFKFGATRVDVVIDNNLTTVGEASSAAFIAKKDFRFTTDLGPVVPEPGIATILVVGLFGLAMRRR